MEIIDNVYIGAGVLDNLKGLVAGRDVIYITDSNVGAIYADFFATKPTIIIGTGEVNKTLATIEFIHKELLAKGADRSVFIVGVGGGIVTDVTGFAAATYMRGVDFGFVATTLLAQIDASVGGKNGVNVGGYKNIAGVFKKPTFVLCDTDFLATLPAEELTSAWGEIIKCAIIADASLLQVTDYQSIVTACVSIKASIVAEDFTEKGRRKLLNLGHTIGHSIEQITNGERYLHGQAVAIGIVAVARMSHKLGMLSTTELQTIEDAVAGKGLPVDLPADIDRKAIIATAMADKKHAGNGVDMILIEGIGAPIIVHISADELETLL